MNRSAPRGKVLIGPSVFGEKNPAPRERLEEAGFRILMNPFRRRLTKGELVDLLRQDVSGIIAGLEALNEDVLKGSHLKVISRCGAGTTNVDLTAAGKMGIDVFSTPDAPTNAVAELTLGAMISLLRLLPRMNEDLHSRQWKKQIGCQLEGKVIAVIGFGRIGRRLVELLSPFRVHVLAIDPAVRSYPRWVVQTSLDEALARADIVSLHASGEECVLGPREISLMKRGAFLLNGARGGLVDEDALARALENGQIRGVWLDAYEEEPYTGILTKYPQAILTPHVGSYTEECRVQMETEAVKNLIRGFERKGL